MAVPGIGRGRRAGLAVALALACGGGGQVAAQDTTRYELELQIDCPDTPLYVEGGMSLVRDPDLPGLVLVARLPQARGGPPYALNCATEAAAGGAAEDAYEFVCRAWRGDGASGSAEGRMRGVVPSGVGVDHPDVRAAIASAVCPAARLALARLRASGS